MSTGSILTKKLARCKLLFTTLPFDINTDDWNPNFQPVKKKQVHSESDKRFWHDLPHILSKNFLFQNRNFAIFHFHFNYFVLWNLQLHLVRCKILIILNKVIHLTQKNFPNRLLSLSKDCLISTDPGNMEFDLLS